MEPPLVPSQSSTINKVASLNVVGQPLVDLPLEGEMSGRTEGDKPRTLH
ncbi:hypothetical protein At1D1460_31480 [Agrobacterium tumefaciens]|nr:hypothetical protein At1D1460_31480 [Agrobacterium tumefaciens]